MKKRVLKTSEPKWCLMVQAQPTSWRAPIAIMALTDDCIEAARERGWLLLARDQDVYGVSQ